MVFSCCLLEACSLLKGTGWGIDLGEWAGGTKLGEVEVGMYCMRKESINQNQLYVDTLKVKKSSSNKLMNAKQ